MCDRGSRERFHLQAKGQEGDSSFPLPSLLSPANHPFATRRTFHGLRGAGPSLGKHLLSAASPRAGAAGSWAPFPRARPSRLPSRPRWPGLPRRPLLPPGPRVMTGLPAHSRTPSPLALSAGKPGAEFECARFPFSHPVSLGSLEAARRRLRGPPGNSVTEGCGWAPGPPADQVSLSALWD